MTRVPHRILVLVSLLVAAYAIVRLGTGFMSSQLEPDALFAACGMAIFTIVGALIEDRRSGNAIGRICLATGLTLVASLAFRAMAETLDGQPGALPPVGAMAAVVSQLTGNGGLAVGSLLLISRFPEGRADGLLGRIANWNIVLLIVMQILQALQRGRVNAGWVGAAPNPVGFLILPTQLVEAMGIAGFLGLGVGLLAGTAGLIARYRSGSALARAQIRWLFAAISISAILLGVILVAPDDPAFEWAWTAWLLSFLLTPIAIAIAILRYRLYEIDRIIGRTIGYTVVTGVLTAVFLGTNLALGTWVAAVTGGSTVAVAASTLLAAALFQPLRRAVQTPIDRRFNRAHIDGERTLARFGDRVREEVDLANLSGAVLMTADQAVRPAAAGLWLRRGAPE